jgi:carotenoid cleavage dioxygenase
VSQHPQSATEKKDAIMGNPYLEGNFAPLGHEYTVTELPVTGTIPAHLDGRYLRNGPNPYEEIDPVAYHWFTGDGMVHGVRIRDGKAEWYRNRWVRSRHLAASLGETPPRHNPKAGWVDNGSNTNIIGHAGKTLALVESGVVNYELSEELETVGPCDFDGTVSGGYTAHPKRDPATGDLHAVSYSWNRGRRVQYSVIGPDGRAKRTVDIAVTGSPMMHDFSLTEKYVVFYDLPVTFDAGKVVGKQVPALLRAPARLVLSGLMGRIRMPDPLAARAGRDARASGPMPYSWNPRYPARVGVMPRSGGSKDVRWFDIEPCYVYHPLNAYDDGDQIVLDVVRHGRTFATDNNGPFEAAITLDRWTVDLNAGKVLQDRLDDRPQEFPRVDERLVGRRHRYGYAVEAGRGRDELDTTESVIKHDLVTGRTIRRSFGAKSSPGEVVFVPNGPDSAEDDGVLMGFVYHPETDRSDLMLLDAGSLDTVAAVHLPNRVPNGFHGNWVPTAQ